MGPGTEEEEVLPFAVSLPHVLLCLHAMSGSVLEPHYGRGGQGGQKGKVALRGKQNGRIANAIGKLRQKYFRRLGDICPLAPG